MNQIAMTVFKPAGRKFHQAQWRDPVTGRKKTQSTGETKKRDAERVAGKILQQVIDGTFHHRRRMTWATFRERFEAEVIPSVAIKTQWKKIGTLNHVETLLKPATIASIDAAEISRFAALLRKVGLAEGTVKGHLSNVKSMLRWARRQKLIREVPEIEMPTRCNKAGGRPVTAEEFDRLLEAVPKVTSRVLTHRLGELEAIAAKLATVAEPDPETVARLAECRAKIAAYRETMPRVAETWKHLLRGLWASGLRLGEALNLQWTDGKLAVDFSGRRPMLRIKAAGQKSGKDETLPVAPEFAAFLAETPEDRREGFVFHPLPQTGENRRLDRVDTVSTMIQRIGKAARIKVAEKTAGGKTRTKFASAHDLRRSFGDRWSRLVPMPILQTLMRHADIKTTLAFYVDRTAETAADVLWGAVAGNPMHAAANTLANTRPNSSPADVVATPQAAEV
jgi:integrase